MRQRLLGGWQDPRALAMGLSLLVALLMIVGKLVAFLVTDSVAIYSDLAESVVQLTKYLLTFVPPVVLPWQCVGW